MFELKSGFFGCLSLNFDSSYELIIIIIWWVKNDNKTVLSMCLIIL